MPRTLNPNILGASVTLRDGILVVPQTNPVTKQMTLVDFAYWGPVNDPVNGFSDAAQVRRIFGGVQGAYGNASYVSGYNGNALAFGAMAALQAGNQNLTLVRPDFGGAVASTTLFFKVTDEISVTSVAGNEATPTANALVVADSVGTDAFARIAVGSKCWKGTDTGTLYTVASVTAGTRTIVLTEAYDADLDTETDADWTFTVSRCASVDYDNGAGEDVTSDENIVLTFAGETFIPSGLRAGHAAWISTDTTTKYSVVSIDAAAGTVTLSAPAATVTAATGATWCFGTGITIAGAYQGALGNAISYKFADSIGTALLYIKTPEEFDSLVYNYSSVYTDTLGALASKVNADLAGVATITLSYADENDSFLAGIVSDVEGTAGAYLTIGAAVTASGQLAANATVVAGTNFSASYGNPSLPGVSLANKRAWYAGVLGNILDTDDQDKTLPLLNGQPLGFLVIPSLHIDELVETTNVEQLGAPKNFNNVANDNLLQYILNFCHAQYSVGLPTKYVIDFTPIRSVMLSTVKARFELARAIGTASGGFMNGELKNLDGGTEAADIGRYLSVVAGPQLVVVNKEAGVVYKSGGATQYATLMTTLKDGIPPSQKVIPGNIGVDFTFNNTQVSLLSGGQGNKSAGGAYVVFMEKDGQLVVNAAVTCAKRASDFAFIHNLNVIERVSTEIRAAVSAFIGNPFRTEHYNAMYTNIMARLDALNDAGIINGGKGQGYRFVIEQTPVDQMLGYAKVKAQARPAFELKFVDIDVELFA